MLSYEEIVIFVAVERSGKEFDFNISTDKLLLFPQHLVPQHVSTVALIRKK